MKVPAVELRHLGSCLSHRRLSRRALLLAGGGGLAAATGLTACGGDEEPEARRPAGADATALTAAAGFEVAAVNAYDLFIARNEEGQFAGTAPAMSHLLVLARDHHQAHRVSLNRTLSDSGEAEVIDSPPDLSAQFVAPLESTTDGVGLARMALAVEETLGDTYYVVLPSVASADTRRQLSTIQPVEMQHAAVLRFLLGEFPIPAGIADGESVFVG